MLSSFRLLRSVPSIGRYTAAAILNAALAVLLPTFLGRFVDSLVYGTTAPVPSFLLLAGTSLCALLLGFWTNDYLAIAGNRLTGDLRKRILRKTTALAPWRIGGERAGEIAAKFHQDVATAGQILSVFYARALGLACALVFAWVLVFVKRPLICLIFLAPLPIAVLLATRRQKRIRALASRLRLAYQDVYRALDSYLRPLAFLRALDAEKPFLPDPVRSTDSLTELSSESNRAAFRLANEQRLLLFLGETSILAIAGHLVHRGAMPVGDMVLFQTIFVTLFSSLSGLFDLLPSWEGIREALRSLDDFDAREEEFPGETPLPADWDGELRADHLAFSYPGQDRKILDDLSFHIGPGELVALTGPNGSGKTTLLKIISSYMAPTAGKLFYGKIPSQRACKKSLRDKLGIVFQDQLLLDGTIRENITLRSPSLDPGDLEGALRASGVDEIAGRMPKGLETPVTSGGSLSGGERQKVALARALARHPSLLILDEVSNHLDLRSRERLARDLARWKGTMTIILVTHDPALLELCDQTLSI